MSFLLLPHLVNHSMKALTKPMRSSRAPHRTARRNPTYLWLELLEGRWVPSAVAEYGQIPLSFEANQGQTDPQVNFLSRGSGYALYLTPTAAVLNLQQGDKGSASDVLSMRLGGADPAARVAGLDKQTSVSNYFIGNDPSQWRTNVANYGQVAYQNVYPGIDLTYYGNQRQLEYDFTLAPGADPRSITLAFQGAEDVTVSAQGDLVLSTSGGNVVEHAPILYQEVGGARQAVSGRYVLEGKDRVGFQVDAYDRGQALIIDPVLSYSTYLGGSGADQVKAIAVDSAGNAYLTGLTNSANLPTVGALQPKGGGGFDAFVAKLNVSGTALVYSTYLGGSQTDGGNAIAVDASGNAYVTGATRSSNFPTTPGAFQPAAGPGNPAFVTKLTATGSLAYSTYLHGSSIDIGYGIALDASGNAYITGQTGADFPTTSNAVEPVDPPYAGAPAFVTELNAAGSALAYSTYLGGIYSGGSQGNAIAVDSAGYVYVTGMTGASGTPAPGGAAFPTTTGAYQTFDANTSGVPFVTKLNPNVPAGSGLSGLVYSTFLDGTTGNVDQGKGIAVDTAGNAYITGTTLAADFPTTASAFQTTKVSGTSIPVPFVTKLNAAGSALVYSTFLGGSGSDYAYALAVDGYGNAYITGSTGSTDFPTTSNAVQASYPTGSAGAAFVTELNSGGSGLLYSTFLGGSSGNTYAFGIALDTSGNIYVSGGATSTNLPTLNAFQPVNAGGNGDGFVAKITQGPDFSVTGFPTTTTAGAAGTFTVIAQNADGTTNTNYTGTVHFTSSDPQAVLQADYAFTAADQGVHTFSAALKTAGYQSLTATDTLGVTGGQGTILVKPAGATHFAISAPASVSANTAFSITVTALDANGNIATGYTGTVHFTDSVTGATLPANYTFKASDNGVHTFTGLKLKTKSKQTLTVVDTLVASIIGSWVVTVT